MGMLYRGLEVAEELAKEGISVEIVDPRTLRPMDADTIIGSVRKTHRAVVLEAGGRLSGRGAGEAGPRTPKASPHPAPPPPRAAPANPPLPSPRQHPPTTHPRPPQ